LFEACDWSIARASARHGILFDSSASVYQRFTDFRKMSTLFIPLSTIFHVINAVNLVEMAELRFNQCSHCGKSPRNGLLHIEVHDFHIAFHNLRQIVRELRLHARAEFHVWQQHLFMD
jgi:hypothetical protein